MVGLALNIGQVFINPNGKCSDGTSYILLVARTSQQIDYKFSSTGSEVFHGVNALSDHRLKSVTLPSATNVV